MTPYLERKVCRLFFTDPKQIYSEILYGPLKKSYFTTNLRKKALEWLSLSWSSLCQQLIKLTFFPALNCRTDHQFNSDRRGTRL